ncbi:MAG: SH3 domain-containing protein, partial [Aestuariivirgaceae bacterium]
HDVSWVFTRKELPVEIIAEFEHWRRVRDSDGEEGWIYQSLLAGRRTAMIAPWRKDNSVPLHVEPSSVSDKLAFVSGGVVGRVQSCDGTWCRIVVSDYDGYVDQAMLWGVYPGEQVER